MKKNTSLWIQFETDKQVSGEEVPMVRLTSRAHALRLIGGGVIALIFFLAYQSVFKVLLEGLGPVLGFSLLYATGMGFLGYQGATLWIHLQGVRPEVPNQFLNEGVEAREAFEWIRPSFHAFFQVLSGLILLAGVDLGLSWMHYQITQGVSVLLFLGLVKIGVSHQLSSYYRMKRTRFGHLVGDYALAQKMKEDSIKKHLT